MSPSIDQLVAAAETWLAYGCWVIAVDGKRSHDPHWNTRHVSLTTLRRQLVRIQANGGEPGIAVVWGRTTRDDADRLFDLEWDTPEQKQAARDLLGDAFATGAVYRSPRSDEDGSHWVGIAPPEWASLGTATVKLGSTELTIRIGGAAKGSYSVVPPNADREFLPGRGLDQRRGAPESLRYAVLEATASKSTAVTGAEYMERPLDTAAFAALLADVRSFAKSIEGAGGDAALYDAMEFIAFAGGTLDQQLQAGRLYNAERCDPSWPDKDIERVLNNARKVVAGIEAARDLFSVIDAGLQLDKPTAAPENERLGIQLQWLDTVKETQAVDLWPGYIDADGLTILAGDPKSRKSYALTDLAARVSTGRDWPDGQPCKQGAVFACNVEDSLGSVQMKRYRMGGADMSRIACATMKRERDNRTGKIIPKQLSLQDIDDFRRVLDQHEFSLMIFDPLGSLIGGGIDSYRDEEMRTVLQPLNLLAQEYQCAIVVVAHTTKSGGKNPMNAVMGSRAVTGAARTLLHAMVNPSDRDHTFLAPGGRNNGLPGPTLGYRIMGTPGVVTWDENPHSLTAFDIVAMEQSQDRPKSQKDLIWAFLDEQLRDGPRPTNDVNLAASAQGFNLITVDKVSRQKGVERFREGNVYMMANGEHTITTGNPD